MTDEMAQVSNLIGDIYDASLDPALWPSVLEKTCGYIQGVSAGLVSHDTAYRNAQLHVLWNDNPEFTRSFHETYVKINPLMIATQVQTKAPDIVAISDLIPYDEYQATRLYHEWAEPQGYGDGIQAVLEKSITSYGAVVVNRHLRQGLVDAEARGRMGLLAPHFRRAVNIGKVIDLHKVEAAALADTLDGLTAAMFLVDAGGRIVHANAAGHAMLAEAAVVRASGGKLAAADAQAHRALHDIFMNADDGDAAVGTKGIAVPMTSRGGERFVAHVLPLTSGARRTAGVAYSAVAAVFVRKAELDLPYPLEALADAYKLTPAEMRVLMMIVQVGGAPEVAPVLGISEATVKTHLQRVFAKTGTNRQADLVKLVAGYMSPLGG